MLILLFIILIGIMLFFEWKHKTGDTYNSWDMHRIVTIPLLIMLFIAILILSGKIIEGRVIDNKIKLYKEQNKEIEQKIEIVVKEYMNYEGNTLKEFKPDSYITLVNLYPELKADKLIQQQINLYTENNDTIIELKESKLDITIEKWWIYFGK